MHRVLRIGPQPEEGRGLAYEPVEWSADATAMTEERVDREGRAASSGMRGEKYRDEVELERSEGNDRPTRRAGGGQGSHSRRKPTRREVVKNHSNALCRTLGDRVRVRNARGELYPGGRV